MEELFKIEDLLEALAEEIEPHLPLITEFFSKIKSTDKPLSILSKTTLFTKIESIRIGVFEVAKVNEYYSLNILYRSLLEHFIKYQYIWMKTIRNNDDEIGIDYWVFGNHQENIDYAKALQQSYSLVGINSEISVVEILKNMGVISNDNTANQIRKKFDQFKYKNMTHYIAEQMKTKKSGAAPILSSIFPRYSELSSCVHGGPVSVGSYETGLETAKEILKMSTFASLHTRWLEYIQYYQYDNSFEPLCQIAKEYLRRFTSYNQEEAAD